MTTPTPPDDPTLKDNEDYELRDEYDLAKMTIVPKGRFSPRRMGKNVAILEPEVATAFPTDEAVNAALRLVLQISSIPKR